MTDAELVDKLMANPNFRWVPGMLNPITRDRLSAQMAEACNRDGRGPAFELSDPMTPALLLTLFKGGTTVLLGPEDTGDTHYVCQHRAGDFVAVGQDTSLPKAIAVCLLRIWYRT